MKHKNSMMIAGMLLTSLLIQNNANASVFERLETKHQENIDNIKSDVQNKVTETKNKIEENKDKTLNTSIHKKTEVINNQQEKLQNNIDTKKENVKSTVNDVKLKKEDNDKIIETNNDIDKIENKTNTITPQKTVNINLFPNVKEISTGWLPADAISKLDKLSKIKDKVDQNELKLNVHEILYKSLIERLNQVSEDKFNYDDLINSGFNLNCTDHKAKQIIEALIRLRNAGEITDIEFNLKVLEALNDYLNREKSLIDTLKSQYPDSDLLGQANDKAQKADSKLETIRSKLHAFNNSDDTEPLNFSQVPTQSHQKKINDTPQQSVLPDTGKLFQNDLFLGSLAAILSGIMLFLFTRKSH